MAKTAYLVVWLDTARLKIMKIGIYSEPHPTPNKERWQPALLATMHATDYETAVGMLCEHIADNVARPGLRDIATTCKRASVVQRARTAGSRWCESPSLRHSALPAARHSALPAARKCS